MASGRNSAACTKDRAKSGEADERQQPGEGLGSGAAAEAIAAEVGPSRSKLPAPPQEFETVFEAIVIAALSAIGRPQRIAALVSIVMPAATLMVGGRLATVTMPKCGTPAAF